MDWPKAALRQAEEHRRREREMRFAAAHPSNTAHVLSSMVVPVSPSTKFARFGAPAPRERHHDEAWEQDDEERAKHRRVVPAWALEPEVAPVSSHPRKRLAGAAATAATLAPGSSWANTANRGPIDLTGQSPQPPTVQRQSTLSRSNARILGWPGRREGASGPRPSRRSGKGVVVIKDDDDDDDSPPAAFALESDDEGSRSTSWHGGRSRDLVCASGFPGTNAMSKGEPRAARRDSAVVLIDEGRGDKGKAPADERPADAPAMAARGDKMQITSTVSRSFTCPICYEDVEKGG